MLKKAVFCFVSLVLLGLSSAMSQEVTSKHWFEGKIGQVHSSPLDGALLEIQYVHTLGSHFGIVAAVNAAHGCDYDAETAVTTTYVGTPSFYSTGLEVGVQAKLRHNKFFADATVRGGVASFRTTKLAASGVWNSQEMLRGTVSYYVECGVMATNRLGVGVYCMSGMKAYYGEVDWTSFVVGLSLSVGID